jgi:hypothetical protein
VGSSDVQAVRPSVLEGVWRARGAGAGSRRPCGPLPGPPSHGDEGSTLIWSMTRHPGQQSEPPLAAVAGRGFSASPGDAPAFTPVGSRQREA